MDNSKIITPRSVRVKKSPRALTNLELPPSDESKQTTIETTLDPSNIPTTSTDSAEVKGGEDGSNSLGRVSGTAVNEIITQGRRRKGTITERLFQAEERSSPDLSSSGGGRIRSDSVTSSRGSIRATAPVQIAIKGRRNSISGRRGSISLDDQHHAEDEVDLLEVLDQSVSTTSNLVNITGAFFPNTFSKAPVCELEPPIPEESSESDVELAKLSEGDDLDEEEDPLDAHLAKLLKRQKRKETARQILRGVWTFLKTPLGVFFGIYGFLVVVAGAGLVLVLIGAIPMSYYNKTLVVEIFSQILTGLFTITSLLPLPWRLNDSYQIFLIYSYARRTYERRAELGLPPLSDRNDLPEPLDAEYWIGPGGEKLTGPRSVPSKSLPKVNKKKEKEKKGKVEDTDRTGELDELESKAGSSHDTVLPQDDVVVLKPQEEERLRAAQLKYSRSQTWFRPHTTPTHHATPITSAIWVSVLLVSNSVFQAFLCGTMWGLNRFNRPAWTTGVALPLSFLSGIGAAIIMWRSNENTKRKSEVTRKVWQMLKNDEEDLAKRAKEAAIAREALKHPKRNISGTTATPVEEKEVKV